MSGQLETVIAGSKPFALALFAPLTERTGARPRIAADPAQAASLLPEAGIIIVELQDLAWLSELQRLRAARPALRFVAALHAGSAPAAGSLRAMDVESVAWTGAAAELLSAVDRALGRAPAEVRAPPAPAPAPAPPVTAKPSVVAPPAASPAVRPAAPATVVKPPAPVAPKGAPPAPAEDDFDLDVSVDAPPPATSGPLPGGPAVKGSLPDWTPTGAWPASAPDLAISEEALFAGMDGTPPPFPALGSIATQVAGALSDLEVKAIARAKLEFDGTPLRRAAAMRVRVGFALATVPPRGSVTEPTAVAALLAEIDEILSEVNALADNAPPERSVALGAARNALVKEAIDFSEVAQRFVAREVEPPPEAPLRPPKPRTKTAVAPKVLSVRSEPEPRGRAGRERALIILVLLAAAGALAYHGLNFLQRREVAEEVRRSVVVPAPPGYRGMDPGTGGPIVLQPTGEPVDKAAVERFKADEKLKGNEVIESAGGALVIQPGAKPSR